MTNSYLLDPRLQHEQIEHTGIINNGHQKAKQDKFHGEQIHGNRKSTRNGETSPSHSYGP